jgi:hypothetical protein
MRFRSKFAWLQLCVGILWITLSCMWLRKPSAAPGIRGAYLITGILWLFMAISCITDYFFVWWGIEDAGLIQHRRWNTRTIPWDEITRVGPWQPNNKPMYNWLVVDYARPAPISDRGELILFKPADRDASEPFARTRPKPPSTSSPPNSR